MRLKALLITVSCLLVAGFILADDDVMITRDGSMMIGKNEVLSLTTSSPEDSTMLKASNSADNKQKLLASATAGSDIAPALGMNAAEIEMKVNAINPYTLYRKGSVAEYCFKYKGKQTTCFLGSTYFQLIVSDEKIENGLLVAHIKWALFNKKHEPLKGIPSYFKECIFPVEIDTAGTYYFTHNLVEDYWFLTKRRGFGVLIPGDMQPGMQLKSSTIYNYCRHPFIDCYETAYSDWQVVGEEKITTPAGTFECVKLKGRLDRGSKGKYSGQTITCWMARGIGMVQYEKIDDYNKKKEPFVVYLNKIDIK